MRLFGVEIQIYMRLFGEDINMQDGHMYTKHINYHLSVGQITL